jgi:hypothetical protein
MQHLIKKYLTSKKLSFPFSQMKTEAQKADSHKVLISYTSAEEENEKVPASSVPASKTSADFNQSQYLASINQRDWKVTVQEYYAPAFRRGFKLTKPLTKILKNNLINLLGKVNKIRLIEYGKPMIISSGARSKEHNAIVNGATHSTHQSNEGIDIMDVDGSLKQLCVANNNEILKKYDLYMEHPAYTKGWCHLQTRATIRGNRIFIP